MAPGIDDRFLLSRRGLALCSVPIIILLALNSLVFYRNTQTLIGHERLVAHTQEVLGALDTTLAEMTAAESAQRGYIIVGRPAYLAAYSATIRRIGPRIAHVQSLTADNPTQQRRIGTLRQLASARLADLARAIALQRRGQVGQARQVALSDRGIALMDRVRGLLGTMTNTELELLVQRKVDTDNASTLTTLTLVLATVGDVALLGGLLVVIARAVSRRNQTTAARERLLEHAEAARVEAIRAVAARDAFLSLAAHELRTPLTALLGNAQLLRRRLDRQDPVGPREQRLVGALTERAERMRRLIEQLLDVARLQGQGLTLDLKDVDLRALVGQTVETATHAAGDEAHPIRLVTTEEEGPLLVSGDELRLEQAMDNLLSNAIKYSPGGGRITVAVSRQGTTACVAVTDEGIGIPPESLPRVFEQFYRAANVSPASIGGLGVGLYVVKEIVTRHGGTVEAASAEGAGSTFTLVLPLAIPAEQTSN